MGKFIITTDSSCDAGFEELTKLQVPFISFSITDEKGDTVKDLSDRQQNISFYRQMEEGKVFKTSQINAFEYQSFFEENAKDNLPIIHISLAEALSNSINNSRAAAIALKEKGIEVHVVDTTIGCLGNFIIIKEAVKCRDEGLDVETTINRLTELSHHVRTLYTTGTLKYLARGGRLSKAAAIVGNVLRLNLILNCNAIGKLRFKTKAIGQKKAYRKFIDTLKEEVVNPENQILYCCHSEAEEEMKNLASQILKEIPFKDVSYHSMGLTIGAHGGPGLLAVFYVGKLKTDFE